MKKKSSSKAATKIETLPVKPQNQLQDQRREIFNLEVALGSTTTPDPFAMPPTGNSLFAYFELWQTLENKQHPFEPPHPLAYGGTLNYDWHSFLRGPMNPFIEALSVLSPVARGNTPSWAVQSASKCLKDLKCNASESRPSSVGWCLGLDFADVKFKGIAAVALVAGLRHVEQIAQLDKELLTDGLLRRSRAFPVRNKICHVPFRHGGERNKRVNKGASAAQV